MIQVIQAAGYFFPDSTGGSEVYVGDLARELRQLGCESTILAPARDLTAQSYEWQGLPVHRYPWDHAGDRSIISGARPHLGFDAFLALLERTPAGIYHQHGWSGGSGLHHLRAARERGMRTVTTVHLSGNVCLAGTMMRMGRQVCDGRIDEYVCSTCWAVSCKGIPAPIAGPMTRLSRAAAHGGLPFAGGLARLTAAFDGQRDRFEQMVANSDRIVAVCRWLYDALLLNGVAPEKLVLCRQGVGDAPGAGPKPPRQPGQALRVGFLGRYDPIKGLHVLVRALRRLPAALPIELCIHGVANGPAEADYASLIRSSAGADPRIRFVPPVARDRIRDALAGFDVLAVPSQVLETGPLVVMEAHAAGTPVLGSDLGGISELVTPGDNGWLVAHDSVRDWAAALARLCEACDSGAGSMTGWPVRTMRAVAQETIDLYARLLASAR